MVLNIIRLPGNNTCSNCKRQSIMALNSFLIESDNDKPSIVLCNACIDDALFNQNIIEEDF